MLPESEEMMETMAELSQELHEWIKVNENVDPEIIAALQAIDAALGKDPEV